MKYKSHPTYSQLGRRLLPLRLLNGIDSQLGHMFSHKLSVKIALIFSKHVVITEIKRLNEFSKFGVTKNISNKNDFFNITNQKV